MDTALWALRNFIMAPNDSNNPVITIYDNDEERSKWEGSPIILQEIGNMPGDSTIHINVACAWLGLKIKDDPKQSPEIYQALSLCHWTAHLSIPVDEAAELVKFHLGTKDLEAIYASKKKHDSCRVGEFLAFFSPSFKVGGGKLPSKHITCSSFLRSQVRNLISAHHKTHALLGPPRCSGQGRGPRGE